jgi:hypothetical protein
VQDYKLQALFTSFRRGVFGQPQLTPPRQEPPHRSGRFVWVFFAYGWFAVKTPVYAYWSLLDSLDSLVRIETNQRVARDKREKVFLGAFSPALQGAMEAGGPGSAETRNWSWVELNLVSDLLQ